MLSLFQNAINFQKSSLKTTLARYRRISVIQPTIEPDDERIFYDPKWRLTWIHRCHFLNFRTLLKKKKKKKSIPPHERFVKKITYDFFSLADEWHFLLTRLFWTRIRSWRIAMSSSHVMYNWISSYSNSMCVRPWH